MSNISAPEGAGVLQPLHDLRVLLANSLAIFGKPKEVWRGVGYVAPAPHADLYARLAHVVLRLPPLRERREELLELAARLAPQLRFSADAAEALLLWHWPRNVRELRALLDEASALVAGGTTVRLRDLRDRIHEATERVRHRPGAAGSTPPEASEPHPGVERRERLLALFREHQGNVSRVAAELGTPRAQVYRWLRAAGLEASELRARKA